MMHYIDTIITIVDSNKKTIRELESEKQTKGRKCKVFLPFDTEYQFYIKNNNDRRIKLDIEIDGSLISDNGFIINSYQTCYLERFLNSNEKFKFVKASHEAVSDPTNRENGIIKIRVYKEKPKYIQNDWFTPNYYKGGIIYNSGIINDKTYLNTPLVGSCNVNYSANINDVGATIGGSISNQQFSTTHWNGDDGVDSIFTFIMCGTNNEKEEKLKQYLKLKEELGI